MTLANLYLGLRLGEAGEDEKRAGRWLKIGLLLNLGFLLLARYIPFLLSIVEILLETVKVQVPSVLGVVERYLNAHSPSGISFITFVNLAYLFDVYNQKMAAERSPWRYLFHVLFFPKAIAGPIMRYEDSAGQMDGVGIRFGLGVNRFIVGLAKKVVLANPLGMAADNIFSLTSPNLTTATAWLGAVVYALQIYYDFSGYSDMAIGLGQILGFKIPENFNYPYAARSITDFWRRWHITLSNWFRDYVFMPLEYGRRGKKSRLPQYRNILIVFLLTGLWHGVGETFIVWGLLHGLAIVFERLVDHIYPRLWSPVQRAYTLFILLVSWVFFRSDSLPDAFTFLKAMFGFSNPPTPQRLISMYLTPYLVVLILAAILFATPLFPWLKEKAARWKPGIHTWVVQPLAVLSLVLLLAISLMGVADATYQGFIYFRF